MILAAVIVVGVALILAVIALVAFAVLVAGVRATDRRQSLRGASRGRADAFARWVLDVHAHPSADSAHHDDESSRLSCA